MLRAGVLALAITASSLGDSEFDAEAWKAQKDEELKFLLKVRELAHEHARVAAGSRFDDDRWGRRWALGEAAYNYGTAHLVGKFSCATSYAESAPRARSASPSSSAAAPLLASTSCASWSNASRLVDGSSSEARIVGRTSSRSSGMPRNQAEEERAGVNVSHRRAHPKPLGAGVR